MVIGSLFSSEETSILASISTGSLFLFLSGVILPIEGMSAGLRDITQLNPFVVAEEVVRRVFIFGGSFQGLLEPFLTLILYSAILFIGMMVVDSLMHQHLVEKVLYKHHKRNRRGKRRQQMESSGSGQVHTKELGHTSLEQHTKKEHRKGRSLLDRFSRKKKKDEGF